MITIGTMNGGLAMVRFQLELDHPGRPLGVAGDFNDWDWQRTPFRTVDGALVADVPLPAGRFRFRYRSADRWFNDGTADEYVDNEFGGVDCLLVVEPR